jgi:hypothetical protein
VIFTSRRHPENPYFIAGNRIGKGFDSLSAWNFNGVGGLKMKRLVLLKDFTFFYYTTYLGFSEHSQSQ